MSGLLRVEFMGLAACVHLEVDILSPYLDEFMGKWEFLGMFLCARWQIT